MSRIVPELPPRWALVRRLGAGGQAEVWEAEDRELSERVAVKVFRAEMSAQARERLRREVRLGRALIHPGLVRVYELIDSGASLAVAMELVPGESVATVLERNGTVPLERVVEIAGQVLETLVYVHAQGVVHRDIKPSNLLLDEAGRVRLADLGLARRLEDELSVTRTAMAVGTPHYMSPEQIRGERATAASDLYAVGVTLYQVVTGRTPFHADSAFEVANLHLRARPTDPRVHRPDCPLWLSRFVLRLLEKRPKDRFSDAGEALAALERRDVLRRRSRSRRVLRVALSVLAAVAVVVAAVAGRKVWRRGETATIDIRGQEVVGFDSRGRETWRREVADEVAQTLRVDVEGSGDPALVVVTNPSDRNGEGESSGDVVALRRDGGLITQAHVADLLVGWPFEFTKRVKTLAQAADIDGDGRSELVVSAPHASFYPNALLIFWPRLGSWQTILHHAGRISAIVPVPGQLRLRLVGVNNRLAMLPFVAEVVLHPPAPEPPGDRPTVLLSPESGSTVAVSADWGWYALLPEGQPPVSCTVDADQGSTVGLPGKDVRVDRFGNLVGGPNEGLDLRQERRAFIEALYALTPSYQSLGRDGVRVRIDEARAAAGNLLREAAYGEVLDLYGARDLARAGELRDAEALLDHAVRGGHNEDITYRLAHLRALGGDLGRAAQTLTPLIETPWILRRYDAAQLLLRLAIEARDEPGLTRAIQVLWGIASESSAAREGVVTSLRGRAHLWWDRVAEADCTVRSWDFEPAGDAIACLARWRLGRTEASDGEAMNHFILQRPDAAWEGRVALAAAQLSGGRANEAVAGLGSVMAGLEPLARDDFMNHQLLDLARGVYVKALLAAGDRAGAVAEARRVRPTLRDGLLPAILVDEVVQEAGGAVR